MPAGAVPPLGRTTAVARCRRPRTGHAGAVTMLPGVCLVRCEALAAAPYACASSVEGRARLVFTAGACPLDSGGNTVAVGDVSGQTEQVMANLRLALGLRGRSCATWSRRPST